MRRLIVFLALSGCSFAFVSGPPPNHAELSYFDCSTSRVAPVLDTVLAGLMTLNVLSLAASSDQEWADSNRCQTGDPNCPVISRNGAMAIDAVLGVAGVAGLVYGFSKTGACRQAKAEQAARGTQQPFMPGSWPPPGGYPPPGQPGQPGYPPQGQPGQPQGTWPPPGQPGQGYPPPGQPQGSWPPPAQPGQPGQPPAQPGQTPVPAGQPPAQPGQAPAQPGSPPAAAAPPQQ